MLCSEEVRHPLAACVAGMLLFVFAAGVARAGGLGEHVAWRGDFPDPTLWKGGDGRFYAYATPGPGLLGSRYLASDDALVWRALDHGPFGKALSDEIRKDWKWVWAPDRVVVRGKARLYVSLVNSAEDSAIAVLDMDGDAGAANNLRILTRSRDTGIKDTIDPEVVVDPETKRVWMFFGSIGMMHRVELTEDGLAVKDGAKYVHVAGRPASANPRRDKVFEGAYLHRRNGWWYLFVSAGWYADASYNLRVGRAQTLDGVFRDREGRLMTDGFATPVLGSEGDFYGPGHNGDFLVGKDGVERIYYHCHWKGTDRKGHSPRIMLSRRLVWDADGWPKAVAFPADGQ